MMLFILSCGILKVVMILMSNFYYILCRDELLRRLDFLNNENYVDFFRDSDVFLMAICLAYFGLAEELLIKRYTKNDDISTRFKVLVDKARLDGLFKDTSLYDIFDKEKDGNTSEWLLSTVRNALFHNGPSVDFDNRKVDVVNDGHLNKLEASFSFDWFLNFINSDVVNGILLNDYKYSVFMAPYVPADQVSLIKNSDDIKDFIENDLLAYDINISFDESSNGKRIKRDDFIKFCEEKKSLFWKCLYSDLDVDSADKANFDTYKSIEAIKLKEYQEEHSAFEYNKKFNCELFKTWFKDEFKKTYPDYNIEIGMFENNGYEEEMFSFDSKKFVFFENTHPAFQRLDIVRELYDIVNYDKVDYLSAIKYLYNLYVEHKDFVIDQYDANKFMREIVGSRGSFDAKGIEERYAESIRKGLIKKGIVQTYDRRITEDIIYQRAMYDDEIHKRCSELVSSFDDVFSVECVTTVMESLKNEFTDYYSEMSKYLEDSGVYSDQVSDIYNEDNLYGLNAAKGVLLSHRDEAIRALLYTLGINYYVMNMDNCFKLELEDTDYCFMDSLNIKGYSKVAYTELLDIKNNKNNCQKSCNKIRKQLTGITSRLSVSGLSSEETLKLTEVKNDFEGVLNDKLLEISQYDGIINSTDVLNYEGVNLASLSNKNCAVTIRNCFAHNGRVHINGQDENGETLITLTDYDENGELSGVVMTDLTSLIKFFASNTFNDVINNSFVGDEDSVGKAK